MNDRAFVEQIQQSSYSDLTSMRQPLSNQRRTSSGQALTELVILLPILVFLAYATVSLTSMVIFENRLFEAARFGAFAAAKAKLSNYQPSGHSSHGEATRRVLRDATTSLYRDFDSANEHNLLEQPMALDQALVSVNVTQHPIPLVPTRSIDEIVQAAGVGSPGVSLALQVLLGWIGNSLLLNQVGKLGLQTDAQIDSTVTAVVRPKFAVLGALAPQTRSRTVRLVGDSWALDDGRDVRTPGLIGYQRGGSEEVSALRHAVAKISNISAIAPAGIGQALQSFTAAFGVIFGGTVLTPLDARVASLNYDHTSQHHGRSNPFDDAYEFNGVAEEQRSFETNHHADGRQPAPNAQALSVRGPYFMGCKQSAARRCRFTTQ